MNFKLTRERQKGRDWDIVRQRGRERERERENAPSRIDISTVSIPGEGVAAG